MQHYCEHCRKTVEARRAPFSNALVCTICGSEFEVDFLAPGTIINGFRIEEEIGRGSFGIVYKALQLNLERMVAMKVLADELAQDSDFVDNFFREARLAARLSHPNIVQAFDAGATPEGIYYFAMELIEGETLESRIRRDGRMEAGVAVDIALKIARALDYAWERQHLTHGDIKPENIILNSSGEAKLADLGLAKTAHEERSGTLMVTPLYAPPEIIGSSPDLDPVRADIYSFGGTLYHMLGGVPPFDENDPDEVMARHLNEIPESLAIRFRVNTELSFLVDRMLAKNPDERPQSWQEVIAALEALDLSRPALQKDRRRVASPLNNGPRNRQRRLTGRTVGILAVLFLLLLLFSLYLAGKEYRQRPASAHDSEWNKLKTDLKFLDKPKALAM
ncbi:MAG: serine/threonine-protein kinase, partial [Victivallales bacterium]|nr:serine/threonine-protein kinase [Victivallales bacterium]